MALHNNLKPGDMFGRRYRLEQFLGAGGFAVVWKAFDTLTKTTVALKIFSTLDDLSIQQLAEEYSQVHHLSHPSIVRAEHFDSIDNIPFLVMKFCAGGNLENAAGRMSQEDVLEMVRQIADALEYLHSQGLVHQDIKPANILTEPTTNGTRYMLSDFGISAKSRTRLSKSMKEGAQGGLYLTFAYAPPEKFSPVRADHMPHKKGDIFSLGITAYELATGHLPFDDLDTGRELQYNPGIQVDMSEIINRTLQNVISACLIPNRDNRPDSKNLLDWISYGTKNNTTPPPINRGNQGGNPVAAEKVPPPINRQPYSTGGNSGSYGGGGSNGGGHRPERVNLNDNPHKPLKIQVEKKKKSHPYLWPLLMGVLIVIGAIIIAIASTTSNTDNYYDAYAEDSLVPVEEVVVEEAPVDSVEVIPDEYVKDAETPEESYYYYDDNEVLAADTIPAPSEK